MVRISKQEERRNKSPRKPRLPGLKTGPKKDNLSEGYRIHENCISGELNQTHFIPKIR